jgi:hypothetical protein
MGGLVAVVVAAEGCSRMHLPTFRKQACIVRGVNTAAARHHEHTCIDMDVIVVQATFPHIFDRQVIRKALILKCLFIWISHFTVL